MVYVFLADGFEEIEAIAPVDILRRAGAEVRTVGCMGKKAEGSHGITITADLSADEISEDGLEMIVLPGGSRGADNLEKSAVVQNIIDYANQNNLWIAAICAAPSILGRKGLLKDRKAVCYPGYENELKGASVADTSVCEDGRIITANGPGASFEFGLALASKLKGKKISSEIRASMQYGR